MIEKGQQRWGLKRDQQQQGAAPWHKQVSLLEKLLANEIRCEQGEGAALKYGTWANKLHLLFSTDKSGA